MQEGAPYGAPSCIFPSFHGIMHSAPEGGFKIQIYIFMSKLSNYLSETKEEMKHVSWPSRQKTFMFMMLVIFVSIGVAAYLGLFDYLFSLGLKSLL